MSMSLSPSDAVALGAIAHGATKKLDQLGLQPHWLEGESTRIMVGSAFYLYRSEKHVNIMNLMAASRGVPKEDWAPVVRIFNNGYGPVDAKEAYEAVRASYINRESDKVRLEMNAVYQQTPELAYQKMPALTAKMHALYNTGKPLEATPSDIYAKDVPGIMFPSLIPQWNEVIRGGYRGGSLVIFIGPPGQGKSSSLYSQIKDGLVQGRRVDLINNENTPQKALHRILRACSHLTEEEIRLRKGNTPERDYVLKSWLGHTQDRLRIYDANYYTTDDIDRILAWDEPEMLFIDYLKLRSGMISGNRLPKDPVGDMSDHLLEMANKHDCYIYAPSQTAGQASRDFLAGKHVEIPVQAYGTDRPQQAANIYGGLKRHPVLTEMAWAIVWKDRDTSRVNTTHDIPFSPQDQAFKFPKENQA